MPAPIDSSSVAASPANGVPSSLDLPIFGREALLATVEQDLALLEEIIELFLAEAPALLAQIRAGLAGRNAEAVERNAHTLKGAVSNFGARRASEAARELEIRGREGRLEDTAGLLSSLETELALVCRALSDSLTEIKRDHPHR